MGLLLRSQLVFPVEGITFSFLLHGHSHVMFLGWVFNVFFIAYVTQLTGGDPKPFKLLFWMLQLLVVGMLVSFPLQGYGMYSIVCSALHTFGAFFFIALFFKRTKGQNVLSVWLARMSLMFFVISSAGPFALGYLKANHLDHSELYRNAIYFYLHFQYNGFFFFGILSLFVKIIEKTVGAAGLSKIKISSWLFLTAVFPTYGLSVLWANPGAIINFIGALGAVIQIAGLIIFVRVVVGFWATNPKPFHPEFKFLLHVVVIALALKSGLQLLSAHQVVAAWINDYRAIVVGYLHLVLVGIITLFLIAWLVEKGIIASRFCYWANRILLTGFIGSEFILFISPWQENFFLVRNINSQHVILGFSVLMAASVTLYLIGSFRQKKQIL